MFSAANCAGKTCVAAYQPKAAASLAASYVNLANPGTYDAAPGVAPTWASATGWAFNGSTQWLNTGVVPTLNGSWTMLIRYVYSSGGNYPTVAGQRENVSTFPDLAICVDNGATGTSNQTVFRNSHVTGFSTTPRLGSGVACIAGNKAYWNGSNIGTLTVGSATGTRAIYIGAQNEVGSPSYKFPGTVQALAIYNATLTAGEVATVSAAMAAL